MIGWGQYPTYQPFVSIRILHFISSFSFPIKPYTNPLQSLDSSALELARWCKVRDGKFTVEGDADIAASSLEEPQDQDNYAKQAVFKGLSGL